jgi:hypothetical protein
MGEGGARGHLTDIAQRRPSAVRVWTTQHLESNASELGMRLLGVRCSELLCRVGSSRSTRPSREAEVCFLFEDGEEMGTVGFAVGVVDYPEMGTGPTWRLPMTKEWAPGPPSALSMTER